jgi:GNAT superfamily N-acetyltransferase
MGRHINYHFKMATSADAEVIAKMVISLTDEISKRTGTSHFEISLADTTDRTLTLIEAGAYSAVIGESQGVPVAVATFTESYALYAAGKVGIIPEFYVSLEHRSQGVGALLLDQVREHGIKAGWACIELCTPPLPEFERTLKFYQGNGMEPVGGRKMRQRLSTSASG